MSLGLGVKTETRSFELGFVNSGLPQRNDYTKQGSFGQMFIVLETLSTPCVHR